MNGYHPYDDRGYRPKRGSTVIRESIPGDPEAPVGLIAGWGQFPIEVAQTLVASGRRVACVAIRGHASTDLESICDHVQWSGVGKMGAHLRYFRDCGVTQVTMAGKLFKHEILYGGSLLWRHLPDWTCIRTFAPKLLGRRRDARDDQLLGAVVDVYHQNRFDICAATDLAPDLLVKPHHFQRTFSSQNRARDAAAGWRVAKQMGAMDIGQSITVKDGVVLAVEAIEGTDACIDRTGELCRRGGWTLVKVSKPNQDMRFDVPTIGTQTIERVARAGGKAIVVEDGKTIIVQRDEVLQLAKRLGVEIVVLSDADVERLDASVANAA